MTLFETLRRRWLIAAVLLVCTLIATAIAFVKVSWTYSASSSVLLLPSKALAKPVGGNPYLAFTYTLTQTCNVLTYQMQDPATAQQLQAAGYTSRYAVSIAPGASAPVLQVTVTGSSKDSVEHTLTGATHELSTLLAAGQPGITAANQIKAKTVTFAQEPTRLSSKKARPLIVVFGIGIALTIIIPSVIDASARRRKGDNGRGKGAADVSVGENSHHFNVNEGTDQSANQHADRTNDRPVPGYRPSQPASEQRPLQHSDQGTYQEMPPPAANRYRNTRA
jgi:capsular polysaccharide biosynthesis protein